MGGQKYLVGSKKSRFLSVLLPLPESTRIYPPLNGSYPMCMFDKFHLTFNFKSKVNVNWHIHFILKCHLNFGLYNILGQLKFWIIKSQSRFVTKKNLLSIERKYHAVLHVSPNVEDGSPILCIHFKPTKRDPHKSIKGCKWGNRSQLHRNPSFF